MAAPVLTQSGIQIALRTFLLAILPAGIEMHEWHVTGKDYVYIHARPNGEPFYIGKGRGRRAINLCSKSRSKIHRDKVSHYGRENIIVAVILCANEQDAFSLERQLIASLRTLGVRLVNMNDGGEGSTNPTPETRAKMAARKIGTHRSDEIRRRISMSLSGRPKDPDHVSKVAQALKGRIVPADEAAKSAAARKGKKQSPERIEKRRLKLIGKKRSKEFREKMSRIARARTSNFGREARQ